MVRADTGIVIVANGIADEARAEFLRSTLSQVGYMGDIQVISDPDQTGFASRVYKTNLWELTPFRDTLFLDTDILALRAFSELWQLLDQHPLWMAPDMHDKVLGAIQDRSSLCSEDERTETLAYCGGDQSYFNTGVILFRRNDDARRFFEAWRAEWLKYQRVDQFSAARVQRTAVYPQTLPTRYNQHLRAPRAVLRDASFLHCWSLPRENYPATVQRFLESNELAIASSESASM
ncbi:MAG: glycosyltransferase [Bryobacteraceae bacterium]